MSGLLSHSDVRISVVINTLNEEHNLPYCLRSVVAWASDIVVVDMHSSDATREIAERYGARVFLHEPLGFSEPARAFAVAQAQCDWVFLLDADELVQAPLYAEVCRLIRTGDVDVIKIPRRNYMFGDALQHTGWSALDDSQTRVFRKSAVIITKQIHRFMRPKPEARVLTIADKAESNLIHFNYVSVSQFIEKLNRYTSIEAQQALEKQAPISPRAAMRLAWSEWYHRYVKHKGYKDGWRGFYLALMMAFYRIATAAKMVEAREAGSAKEIEARYAEIAESVIKQYEERGD